MKPVVIEVNSFKEIIGEIINSYPLSNHISLEKKCYDDRNIYIIKPENNKNMDEIIVKHWITLLIQTIIIDVYGESLIDKRLVKLLKTIDKIEKEEIKKNVIILLNDYEHFTNEKNDINNEIIELIFENNLFNIDGYLRFKSYKINSLIDKSIEIVIEDIEIESEYNEFVNMLQYYVETQIPLIDMVNVIIEKDDFKLYDSTNSIIKSQTINEIIEDIYFEDINKSDILVSSLIILAPRKIVLHIENDKEEDLLMVLRRIFKDKLTICYGCDVCQFNIKKNKDSE